MGARHREPSGSAGCRAAVAKIVHEISNPLNGMFATLQLLERELERETLRSRQRIFETLRDLRFDLERLRLFLDELRDVARPLRLHLAPVSLPETIAEVLRPLMRVSSVVRVNNAIPQDLPPVMADATKLKQALLNLAKNAFEAMPEGGDLTVRAYCAEPKVCLEIADTGKGIPEGIDVFQDFVSSKPGGLGLGLGIAREIIEAHHGSIQYTSEAGKGTVFKVVLPAA
jgi:signal transduction histidine kinase